MERRWGSLVFASLADDSYDIRIVGREVWRVHSTPPITLRKLLRSPGVHPAHRAPVGPVIEADGVDADDAGAIRGRPRWQRLPVLVAVAAGGLLGAPARYELALALPAPRGGFPFSTFAINVTGSFALGALLTLMVEKWPPRKYLRPFFATGVLGAYTTWSTFMVDTDLLLKGSHVAMAASYVFATLAAGLAAVYAGIILVRTWPAPLRRRTPRGDTGQGDNGGSDWDL